MLALPDIDATSLDAGAAGGLETGMGAGGGTGGLEAVGAPSSPGRRRFLAYVAVGAALAATGGTAARLVSSVDGEDPGGGGEGDDVRTARPELRTGLQADLSGPSAALGRGQERARAAVRRFAEDPLLVATLGATGTDAAREALVAYDEAALPLLSVATGTSGT